MSGKTETGAGEVCAPKPLKPKEKKEESWYGMVYVVFSSVSLMKLKECGLENSEVAKDGNTVSIEKWINETVWEDSPKNYSPNTKQADMKIFVDCSDADGDEMYRACGAYGIDKEKDEKQTEFKLISEIEFALRQFRDFLYALEQEYVNGGTVKLCISAVNPMECLMYAFLRMVGLQIKQDSLSNVFVIKVLNNPVISKFYYWFNGNSTCKWKVELHYCGVQRIDVCTMKILTEQGKRMKRIAQMKKLRDYLKERTETWENLFLNCSELVQTGGLSKAPSTQPYRDAVKQWKDQGGLTILGQDEWRNGVSPQPGTIKWVDYPVLEFEGKKRSYYKFYRMIEAAEKAEEERKKATPENLEKQNEQLKKEIERKRATLRTKRENDRKGRLAEIDEKKCELARRKEWGTEESNFWNERYMQDFEPTDDMDKEMGLIEFEGNLMSADQLDGEIYAINVENNRLRQELNDLVEAQNKLQDKIDDLFWDKILTGIQLGLTGVCMVAALFTGPFAGLVIGIGSALIDAGLEIVKWGVIDDFEWNENGKNHVTTLVLDVVSIGLVPLFRKIPQVTRLANSVNDANWAVYETEKVYRAADGALDVASKEFKDAIEYRRVAKIELDAAEKKAAQKVANSQLEPWRDALVMANNSFPSPSLQNAIERTNTQINTIVENTIKKERQLFTTAELEMSNKQGKAFAKLAEIETASLNYEAATISKDVLLKELQAQSLDFFSYYKKNPFKSFNKASYLESVGHTSGLGAFAEGAAKFLGYDNVANLYVATKDLRMMNSNLNLKRIQYISAGYLFLNTSKIGWNLYNGFAYVQDDYINDYKTLTKGFDQESLDKSVAKGQVEADIINGTVQLTQE